jgi:RNA polymerase sigma-70 factor (ECF subfamily)
VEATLAGHDERDTVALEEIYRTHSARLYNLAYRMTGNATDADDLLQDIFLQAHRKLHTFKGDSSIGTWLYRLGINLCLDFLRSKRAKMQQVTASLEDGTPASAASLPEDPIARLDLERAIAALPDSYRAAFVLHDIEGLEHKEVGHILDIAEGTSKSLVHKARLKLRVSLSQRH